MKKIAFLMLWVFASSAALSAPANSIRMTVSSVESRSSGNHDIYFNGDVPKQGCSVGDRAVVMEALPGGKAMFSTVLTAFSLNKKVVIRVDGCLSGYAAKVIKVQVFN